ncbi:hypothetical protein [Azotobacter beijerinckii]|uniref:hypothetical protein n=1 Tax=Azotobacter beijerinckii TaxID=170623 RepID=UPI001113958C|nr:hypothetical protein [Azotobacter beijerinckii]
MMGLGKVLSVTANPRPTQERCSAIALPIGQPVLQVVPPLCILGMSPNAFRRLGYSDVNQAALIS